MKYKIVSKVDGFYLLKKISWTSRWEYLVCARTYKDALIVMHAYQEKIKTLPEVTYFDLD